MSLPHVFIRAAAGEAPAVTVDGVPVAGVHSAQVTVVVDGVPRLALVLSAAAVELELPAGVTVVHSGPSASAFAGTLSPQRLEADALARIDDATQGEAFAAAVAVQAAEFDARS